MKPRNESSYEIVKKYNEKKEIEVVVIGETSNPKYFIQLLCAILNKRKKEEIKREKSLAEVMKYLDPLFKISIKKFDDEDK
ncbi:hypothetical protein COT60_00015 [Candidatus Pacearchaeota archaeon CG09_land_8_20_14_0_10_30_9]|nr:hypothetical protein [Candidatus Pacearchaeota archaeon]OIO40818.1 MAG: hypothetical protein AUJ61_01245 [Candidatus Pacearchaeota archaeon CG1_02_30_18]PIO01525.1 MAG: hypothetical protein COT60_00015 [Candidatus Pacearchaeota archaeon CG09_land_8_20_14_0_10_30_9]PJA71664.1 MAG: hypothetical protein CO153_00195 [Candidatus Pacearchaeota archaeon CG_4_9_14_3_um_filter_30_11]